MKGSRIELPGGGFLHMFLSISLSRLIAAMKFSHLKISRKCWSGETKRLAVERQMSWCTAEHSIFRSQQERDIEIPRFIIFHGFRVPREKRHSLCGEAWTRLELAEKNPLLGTVHRFLRMDTQQLTHVLTILQSVFKLTPPKTKHGTWKRPVGKGTIFTHHRFLGFQPSVFWDT